MVTSIDQRPEEIKISELIQVRHSTSPPGTRCLQDQDHGPSRGPSPNRGSSLPDFQAIGANRAQKLEWLQSRGIDRSAQVKLTKLAHMRYQHPDLLEITKFLRGKPCNALFGMLAYPWQTLECML